jgi:hypothetical protein
MKCYFVKKYNEVHHSLNDEFILPSAITLIFKRLTMSLPSYSASAIASLFKILTRNISSTIIPLFNRKT